MAMILDAFVGRYIGKLSEVIEGEISTILGVKGELTRLRERMESVGVSLEAAEKRRHTDKTIGIWVKKLKDVMYDADDIIDLCIIKGGRLLEDHPSESAVRHHFSLCSCFSCIKFRYEIGGKIRKLNNRLNMILEDQSKLSSLERIRHDDVRVGGVNHRQTSPDVVTKSRIVGAQIEEDTKSLVQSLIKEDNKKYQVLGIVGMGGIGKTTLASNIYNHESIKNNFPIRAWVCISQDFSETKLLKEIIRAAGGNYGEAETKAELVPRLSFVLSKRFFIVLDDVWNADLWEDLLRNSFELATASGRIVVTTRHTNVVGSMRGDGNTEADIHHVKKMDNESGWEMLRKRIFGDDVVEEVISDLKEVGVKIIEKCDGLPLAIKTIAGVLSSKEKTNTEWSKVLKGDAWSMNQLDKELPGALFLSYDDLSSDLKQCFLYCSLFPEDCTMDPDDLIRYWVAEGFVKTAEGDDLMEDVAEDYYRELITRNLLQPCDFLGDLSDVAGNYCKMHDLLRSLALFFTRDESICIDNEQPPNINPSTKIRRLSIVNIGEKVEVPNIIIQQKCLRTLIMRGIWWIWSSFFVFPDEIYRRSGRTVMVENELFKKLRFLRVMDLSGTRLENLPDSAGDLLHLRYLNLRWSRIKELPESIGCLVNLQLLNLASCRSLHTLPKAITKLYNLRCLRLEGTPLTHVPKGIGKLKHLNHLQGFVIGHDDGRDDEGCDLKELQSLSQLRFLEINRLERTQPAGAPVLGNSSFLRTLILNCGQPEDEVEAVAIQRIDKIYNEFSPRSTHLHRLEINDFFGSRFPSWMMSTSLHVSFPNLTEIRLSHCKSCPQLPPLGLLPHLKSLYISEAEAIKTIGPEFLGPRASSGATSFPNLEELQFDNMSNWEEWSFGMVEGVGEERRGAPKLLPRLKKLKLLVCPKLRALPEGLRHATNLHELKIYGANLKEINNLPSLKSLEIEKCPKLEQVENLDKLQKIYVRLETSTTDADGQTERLPQWLLELLQNAPTAMQSLKEFELRCSLPLLKTFLKDGPNWPIIQPIHLVEIQDYDTFSSYIRYTKDPPTFEANIAESEQSVD